MENTEIAVATAMHCPLFAFADRMQDVHAAPKDK
jgi:hypothetical protein